MLRQVTFENLKLFKDIVQSKSISRGAALNDVSQSAASQHIQELERELQVQLLDRSTRPLTPTAVGRLYYEFCRDALRRREEFDSALASLKQEVAGSVRVGSIYSVGLSEMSRLEADFASRYPGATLEVKYLRPERVYEAVLAGEVDLGLVSYPEATKEIDFIPWRQEEMVVAAAPGHPLVRLGAIAAEELQGVDFVGFDEDLPIAREVARFLREHGVTVNVVMHFDVIQMIKEAVALGSGVAILPERTLLPDIQQRRIVGIHLKAPALHRPLGIIHRRRKQFGPAAQGFLRLLQEKPTVAELAGAGPRLRGA